MSRSQVRVTKGHDDDHAKEQVCSNEAGKEVILDQFRFHEEDDRAGPDGSDDNLASLVDFHDPYSFATSAVSIVMIAAVDRKRKPHFDP